MSPTDIPEARASAYMAGVIETASKPDEPAAATRSGSVARIMVPQQRLTGACRGSPTPVDLIPPCGSAAASARQAEQAQGVPPGDLVDDGLVEVAELHRRLLTRV